MANWSNPTVTSNYTDVIADFKSRDDDLATMFDGAGFSNIPVDTIRWNSSNNRFEKWSGTVWNNLTSQYAIDVATLGGLASSAFLRKTPAGDQTITAGKLTLDIGSATPLDLKGGGADHLYLQLFADAAAQTTRSARIGYFGAGVEDLSFINEYASGGLIFGVNGTPTITVNNSADITVGDGVTSSNLTLVDGRISITQPAPGVQGGYFYSNIANRTVPLVEIINDNATGSGVALKVRQDQGAVALDVAGNTSLFAASTVSYASIRLPHGDTPSTPIDGDYWTTTLGFFVHINGVTVGPLIDAGLVPPATDSMLLMGG